MALDILQRIEVPEHKSEDLEDLKEILARRWLAVWIAAPKKAGAPPVWSRKAIGLQSKMTRTAGGKPGMEGLDPSIFVEAEKGGALLDTI